MFKAEETAAFIVVKGRAAVQVDDFSWRVVCLIFAEESCRRVGEVNII